MAAKRKSAKKKTAPRKRVTAARPKTSVASKKRASHAKKPAAKKVPPAKKRPTAAAKKRPTAAAKKRPTAATKKPAGSGKVYGSIVRESIEGQPRASSYTPQTVMDLSVVRRRQPRVVEELLPVEREQLQAIFRPQTLEETLPELENSLEVAEVIDGSGEVVYRLYGWDYGVGYLFTAIGLEVIGFGAQHDIEHWRPEQRDVFVAMDRALSAKDHGFEQPLSFCWWEDKCWKEIEGKLPGTVGSEPWIRQKLIKAMN